MTVLAPEYIEEIFRQIRQLTDHRSLAVLSVAFLEECINELLLAKFIENTKLPDNIQFKGKIDLAHALGLLSEQSHNRLASLNGIRNKLGHHTECDTFDHTKLDKFFANGDLLYGKTLPETARPLMFMQAALMEAMTIRGDIQRTERLQPRRNSAVIYKSVP